jgi:hypothetical protein
LAGLECFDRGKRMTEMQETGWTWRKSRDNHEASLQQSRCPLPVTR